ncbi:TIGR03619 family F420-dependent LLM class oxidoreductase [Microlunatus speluncae]|uniref:TIGR03619 family F420-dependent LLM class oxidoreductase n=1 Tax=Microlunatus speluncae TaxID=2594267 RepID=UPI001266648A|nr:TIGR03619 family F420-dependent LLM class oxidoreductase [Microlunatus speluncae]
MRLGINLPNFGPETTAATLLDWAGYAEDAGFDQVVVSDHVAPTPEVAAIYPPPFHDPFVLLSWLAGRTSTVRLGTSVVVLPYRHPLLVARMSAMVQEYSDGRFVLGVGTGWSRTEFEAFGLDFRARGRTSDDHLDVITRAWAADTVSAETPDFRFTDVATGPTPPGGRLPLWVGGHAPAAIRRAARFGTAWHPINPELGWLREIGLPGLAAAAAELGRPVPELAVRIKARLQPDPAPDDRPLGVGSLGQVVGDVVELRRLGAADLILDTNPDQPRPRNFTEERRQLTMIKNALPLA